MEEKPKLKRGFASMSPEKLRELSSKGGKNSPMNFKNNPELARAAGRKGKKKKQDDGITA